MVIGVKPLWHFNRREARCDARRSLGGSVAGATGQGEIGGERHGSLRPSVARRDNAQHAGGVQHVVIEREVTRGHVADAQAHLKSPMPDAEGRRGRFQSGLVKLAGPIRFQGGFQLAPTADARKAEIARYRRHISISLCGSDWQGTFRAPDSAARRDFCEDMARTRDQTASFSSFATRNATFLLALILIASPVAGLRPMRAARFLT
jgi:hypothetical protein